MNYWLVKSEPDVYSYERLEREGTTRWDGVRNYMARNNLRSMKTGDLCLYYHSNIGLEIVGAMQQLLLVRNPRISVMPVTPDEFSTLLELGETTL